MTVVAFASVKGSPGVTTTALLSAICWPFEGSQKVFIEADPSGGSVGLRHQIPVRPGLVDLVNSESFTALRGDVWGDASTPTKPLSVWDYAQPLVDDGLAVVLGSESPLAMSTLLDANAQHLAAWLRDLDGVDVMLDLGRLGPVSSTVPLAVAADLLFVVAEPDATQLIPASKFVESLISNGCKARWLLVGDAPYSCDRVQTETGIAASSVIDNPRMAELFAKGRKSKKLKKLYSSVEKALSESFPTRDYGWNSPPISGVDLSSRSWPIESIRS